MLNAVNLMLVAANRWQPRRHQRRAPSPRLPPTATCLPRPVAAAEAAAGLAIVLSFHRLRRTVRTDAADCSEAEAPMNPSPSESHMADEVSPSSA